MTKKERAKKVKLTPEQKEAKRCEAIERRTAKLEAQAEASRREEDIMSKAGMRGVITYRRLCKAQETVKALNDKLHKLLS